MNRTSSRDAGSCSIRRRGSSVAVIALIASMLSPGVAAGAEHGPRSEALRAPSDKCGLAYRLAERAMAGREELPAIMVESAARLAAQKERIIGAFRLTYDTAGADAPAMLDRDGERIPGSHEEFVDSAGAILNDVYAYQTGVLGYLDPIQPGQGPYLVNIFQNSYYGETVPGARIGFSTPARYLTHMNIDNDFRSFYSSGMNGLRVTVAHEFFHAIQFGSYGYWSSDLYFMELTSTWMEDVVYDGVNDYYQYLRGPGSPGGYAARGHFAKPDFSLVRTDGLTEYSRAILGKFIEKQYSPGVIRRAWELVPTRIAVDALDAALAEAGSSFREAFLQWCVWNADTGPDADTVAHYPEGREYPRVLSNAVVDYMSPGRSISGTIGTTSSTYYPVTVRGAGMSVIVANLRTAGAPSTVSFRYDMADAGDASFKRLSNGLYVRLDVPDPSNWSTIETAPALVAGVTAAPNPFVDGESRALDFYIPGTARPASVILTVLGVGMERVFHGPLGVRDDLSSAFVQVAEWRPADAFSRPLASGVYVYVLTVDGADHTGKFSVIR